MHPLIRLTNTSITRNGRRLIEPLTWQLNRGEHVAVTGANGSGKTSLLRLMRGEYLPDNGGERVYDFGDGPQHTAIGLRQRIGLVSADMQEFYQLHAARVTGRNVVLAGFFDTPILYEDSTPEQEAAVDCLLERLGIADLGAREMGTLSTGQVRKLLIARSLAPAPDILLLDECLDGLDMVSRGEVLALLEKAAEKTTLVCAAHRAGDVPHAVQYILSMADGRIVFEGNRDDLLEVFQETAPDINACDIPSVGRPHEFDSLLRMENVSVVADGTCILHSVNWQVKAGENWVVFGHNGAGKSTLLKLVLSEIAPYADDAQGRGSIERFGGLTMDEARPLIGVVSPALQAGYGRELGWEVTAEETVLSGYRGSVGMLDEPTSEELMGAREWLACVGLADLGSRRLRHMSYGQQRRVFLARAMAPGPRLLLLDEPLVGLDSISRSFMHGVLQKLAESGTPLVLVTHHMEDRIEAINRVLLLEGGSQIFCGTWEEFEISTVMG